MEKITEKQLKEMDLTPKKFGLKILGNQYTLELDNNSMKKADKLGLIGEIQESKGSTQQVLATLLHIFLIKNYGNMASQKSKNLSSEVIDEQKYDLSKLIEKLTTELMTRYEQVFSSSQATEELEEI